VVVLLVYVLDPRLTVSSVWVAIVVAVVLGLVNTAARPVFATLDVPLNPLTLGASILAANAAILVLLATVLGDSFNVGGVLWYAITTAIIAVASTVINVAVGD